MILSHKYKLLFVHIPKTGGAAIGRTIFKSDHDAKVLGNTHFGITKETAEQYKDYFKFSVVRNPYIINVSAYRFEFHKKGLWDVEGIPNVIFPDDMTFEEYIDCKYKKIDFI